MRILALNPHHGGSHRAFLDGWIAHSRQEFEVLSLPAYKWKWRMRHAAMTFAEELKQRVNEEYYDALFCTDMLNLAEFRGLCPPAIRQRPTVVYFHENQLTYPAEDTERDLHFGFTNLTTALAADAVWWNSTFHRDSFLNAASALIDRMPDFQPRFAIDAIREKSSVRPPGVVPIGVREDASDEGMPLRIVWVSRWEQDKDPQTLFAALAELKRREIAFTVAVLGESFRQQPDCFATARRELDDRITHWGFVESAEVYRSILQSSDVVVSTAKHEFFGIAVVEAVSAGCFPCVPQRLAYPEVLAGGDVEFHDGSVGDLTRLLMHLATPTALRKVRTTKSIRAQAICDRFAWNATAPVLDESLAMANGVASARP